MDIQRLSVLFATTYNPDPNVRKVAELEIRAVGKREGMITALLQIISSDGAEMGVRQACSVWLKNRLDKAYTLSAASDAFSVMASDRQAVKANILPLIINSPSKAIRVQLATCLKILVQSDFPEKWPGLLEAVISLLSSDNPQEIYAGLVATLEIVKAFRYRNHSDMIAQLAPRIFPVLLRIGQQVLASPAAPQTPEFLHYILKTYKNSLLLHMSEHQRSHDSIVPWGQLMLQVVNIQLSSDAELQGEDREKTEWWKAKKFACATLNRLFNRYGNPSQLPATLKKEYLAFAQHFVTTFAPEIFKVYLNQMELHASGKVRLTKKVLFLIFQFFQECVKPKSMWILLKPHFMSLVSSLMFPLLCFDEERREMWTHDPIEYLRISIDEYEDYSSAASAATAFLHALAVNRTKATFVPILEFINTVLNGTADSNQKFGAMNMTVALGSVIMRHPTVAPAMEAFLVTHVLPEFSSEHPFLRAIACEVLSILERFGLQWTSQENLANHFQAVVQSLDDPELPVRVQAALALTEMIKHDSVHQAMSPMIGKIMQDLLKLSEETDLDVLTSTMETIVEQFTDELLPVAAQLTTRLCQSYRRLVLDIVAKEAEGVPDTVVVETENDGEKSFAARAVAKTIATIVQAVEGSKDILSQIQEIIVPIIVLTLEHSVIDLLDNAYDLADSLTFNTRSISPSMWPIFEITYKLFKSTAIDFLEEMLPSLDNFMSFGKDMFIARPDYRAMVLDIYTETMTNEQLGEMDRVNGCKLIESLLLNIREHCDDLLPTILTTARKQIERPAETKNLRLANLEVFVNAILYNPILTFQIIESQGPGLSRAFFQKWFETLNSPGGLPRVHDMKLSILAICGLLELDANSVPVALREGWTSLLPGILSIFKTLPAAVANRKELQEALQLEDEDDDDEDLEVLNLEEDAIDEDVWDEDSAYRELLAEESERLRVKGAKAAANGGFEEAEEESISDESISEELGFISPLDTVEPYLAFKRSLTLFQMNNAAGYQAATTSLGVEMQTFLMEVMGIAEKKEAEVGPIQL